MSRPVNRLPDGRATGRFRVGSWLGACPVCGADGPHPWWYDFDRAELDGYTCATGAHPFDLPPARERNRRRDAR